ncbi:carbohydrate kinase family protein [Marivibrio halodurans]|uniref:Carbohydrate kinase family protein n=1 Tax=Marivibrio halodurans TaxID=2039722 RepID=A0A8J7SHQ0_9PROT|nr:carbohydrate kinase family protein [Marivibrio halodurans]MBP5856568.1 carbohydrate kinase family protein [Marivibrio halodurans]
MRALAIGSAMIDTIVLVASRNIERMTMANDAVSYLLLEQGRKVEAESIAEHVGGGAVNAAVAMARLGAETAAVLKVGTDLKAEKILTRLREEGVAADFVARTDADETGAAVMIASHDRNATIFTRRGANTRLADTDVAADRFAGRDLVYITALSNESADRFPDIVRRAGEAGAFVAANPGIRQLTARAEPFLERLCDLSLLAVNRVEAEALVPALSVRRVSHAPALLPDADEGDDGSEPPPLMRQGLSFGGFDMELASFCAAVRAFGCARLVVSDGTNGAYLADAEGIYHVAAADAVEVRGTAGAGDAFTSTCATLLADGADPARALRAAALNAAGVVGHIDTQSGLSTRAALDARLAAAPETPRVRFWRWTT